MTYRNRKLLNLAHKLPCQATFPHECSEYQGVEPAHSDQQIFGRGHGHKSHDCFFAALCNTAHMMLDTFEREQKQAEWLRAYIKTQVYLYEHGYLVTAKGAL